MRVMSLCLAIGLVFAFCTDALAQPPRSSSLVVRSTQESWSGLAGKLVIESKELKLTDNGRTELGNNYTHLTKPPIEGGLRVQGLNKSVASSDVIVQVVLESGGNAPEIYQGMYLSYADALGLSKNSGPNTKWRMVDFSETSIEKKQRGRGSFYVDTKTQSFELEAINRPGHFHSVDARGFLTLKDTRGHTIKFTKETIWDDLNDGI